MKVHNVPHAVPLSHMVDDFSFLLIHPGVTDNLTLYYSQVWDFNRSAEMRDTEGGASKRSVLEQVDKMRKYLAVEKA